MSDGALNTRAEASSAEPVATTDHIEDARDECAKIIAAIEARGGRIVWEGE